MRRDSIQRRLIATVVLSQAILTVGLMVTGVVATAIGVFTMLVGATTILVELQDDLDYIWGLGRTTM